MIKIILDTVFKHANKIYYNYNIFLYLKFLQKPLLY